MTRACFVAVVLSAAPLFAQAPAARFAVAGSATVDGKVDDAAPLEALLAEAMVKKGLRLVDPERAKAVRAQVTADQAAAGKLPPGLGSLDADWVLGASATCTVITADARSLGLDPATRARMGGPDASSEVLYSASCDATVGLTRLDTGELAGRVSLAAAGAAFTPREATRRAYEKLARAFEPRADALIARASERRPVAVWLFGAEGRAQADEIRAGIGKLEGVASCALLEFGPELARLEVSLTAGAGMDLARAIDAAPELPVRVERASGARLTLRFDPARSFRTRFRVLPLEDRTKDKKLGREVVLAHLRLAALLANSPFLAPAQDPADAQLTISGRATRGKSGEALYELAARRPGAPGDLARFGGKGSDALADAARALQKALPARLAALKAPKGAPALAGLPRALERSRKARALELVRFEAPDLFPARLARYAADEPVATLWVRSATGQPIEGISYRAEIHGFSAGPRLEPAVSIGPATPVSLPLRVALDAQKLSALTQATIGQLAVEVSWKQGGAERAESFVIPLRLLERGAVDWKDLSLAASFVNPRDPAVRSLVAAALRQGGASTGLPPQVARAARLVEALASLELRYVPDPVVPFGSDTVDFVNFPAETLSSRTGDCDDLAVLTASVLEGAGIATRLLTTPGHILVAYDAGLSPLHAADLDFEKGEALALDGRTYIPLEATALGKGYLVAWREGAKEVLRHRGTQALEQLSVREAWKRYPPGAHSGPTAAPFAAPAVLEASTSKALAMLEAGRASALDSRLSRLAARLSANPDDLAAANERAFVLASRGRLDEAAQSLGPLASKNAALRLTFANVLALKGDLAGAGRQLADGAAGQLSKDAAAAFHHNLAIVRFLENDPAGAEASLEKALALDPSTGAVLAGEPEGVRSEERAAPLVLKADLAALLKRTQEKAQARLSGRTLPATTPAPAALAAGRRGSDPESKQLVATALRWLVAAPSR